MKKKEEILIRDVRINPKAFKYFDIIGEYHLGVKRELLIPYILMTYLISKMEYFKMKIDDDVLDYYKKLKERIQPSIQRQKEVSTKEKTKVSKVMKERIDEELDIEDGFIETKPKERITNAE